MTKLAIELLISERMSELGISRTDLVRRAGLKNLIKGRRRLDGLKKGDLAGAVALLSGLPAALDLPPEVVEEAIAKTQAQIDRAKEIAAKARDDAWRASFVPCSYLIGTLRIPSQITIFAVTGGAERHLRVPLDLSKPPQTFADQARAYVRDMPEVPFFGRTKGFSISYSPDHSIRFDINGQVVEELDHADIPGHVIFRMGRKSFSSELAHQRLTNALTKIFTIRNRSSSK